MSCSTKNSPKIKKISSSDSLISYKLEKREASPERPRKHLSLKSAFYNFEPKIKINKNLTILSYIANYDVNNYSAKTALSRVTQANLDYELEMIDKHDEKNTSLSCISEFDLEGEEKLNESFDSCNCSDHSLEEIEVTTKIKKRRSDNTDNEEDDSDLEREWEEIQNHFHRKKYLK